MVRSTTLRTITLLVLCAVLAFPVRSAAAPRPGGDSSTARLTAQNAGDLLGWLRNTLVSFWSKAGCQVDPNGRCVVNGATITTKAGCELDPNGRCHN
ncbi:MAG TPA: hypothetical protein VGH73_14960 [Thermoanaerobaculia bacterium]|jgi:hypothetical protein